MIVVQHIQRQLAALKMQFEIYNEKLYGLLEKQATETDIRELVKLKYQIMDEEKKLEEVVQKIVILEKAELATNLHKALLKLNYYKQVYLFQRLIDISKVGAFIIHGEAGYGQNWLLNRLLARVIQSPNDVVIPVSFCSWQRWDFNVILRKIGERVNLRNVQSLREVVERLHDYWQRQTVVLVFHHVGDIHPSILQELKARFWCELAMITRDQPSKRDKSKLLMFLVDDTGSLGEWPFDCVEQLDACWTPDTPIKPPVIAPIDVTELANWMKFTCEELPSKIRNMSVEDIWQQTNAGTPEVVFQHLCTLSDCDWSELEKLWIKY